MKLDASQEEALLRSAEAEVELGRRTWNELAALRRKGCFQGELDAAESKFNQAKRRCRSDALEY